MTDSETDDGTKRDETDRPFTAAPPDDESLVVHETDRGVVLLDRRNSHAWLESDTAVDLGAMR